MAVHRQRHPRTERASRRAGGTPAPTARSSGAGDVAMGAGCDTGPGVSGVTDGNGERSASVATAVSAAGTGAGPAPSTDAGAAGRLLGVKLLGPGDRTWS